MSDTPWLTVPETADRLRISNRKVYDLIKSGQLKSVRLGRARRIPPDEIDALRKRLTAGLSERDR